MKNILLNLRRIVWLVRSRLYKPTEMEKRAKEIMKNNFFDVKDAIRYLGARPASAELRLIREQLKKYSENDLKNFRYTHMLVAVFRLSILKLQKRSGLFHNLKSYKKEKFAGEKGNTGLYMIQVFVPGSTMQTWEEQLKIIDGCEEVPTVRVVAYSVIGHYLKTKIRLLKSVYVRTISNASTCDFVSIGVFNSGIRISSRFYDDSRLSTVGIAVIRK